MTSAPCPPSERENSGASYYYPKELFTVDYRCGEDGRLLRSVQTTRKPEGADWTESRVESEYEYAEDGRILFRHDRAGSKTDTYRYDYVCDAD